MLSSFVQNARWPKSPSMPLLSMVCSDSGPCPQHCERNWFRRLEMDSGLSDWACHIQIKWMPRMPQLLATKGWLVHENCPFECREAGKEGTVQRSPTHFSGHGKSSARNYFALRRTAETCGKKAHFLLGPCSHLNVAELIHFNAEYFFIKIFWRFLKLLQETSRLDWQAALQFLGAKLQTLKRRNWVRSSGCIRMSGLNS